LAQAILTKRQKLLHLSNFVHSRKRTAMIMHMVCLLSIAGAAAQTAPQWAFKKPDLRRMMAAASKMPDSMIADAKRRLTEQGRRRMQHTVQSARLSAQGFLLWRNKWLQIPRR